jgi:hypothetical protein
MDRIDDCAVESALVSHPTLALVSGAFGENTIQVFSQPFAHVVGRAIGKSDRNNLINIKVLVFAKDLKISLDEDSSFTRARTSSDRHVPVKRMRGSRLFRF